MAVRGLAYARRGVILAPIQQHGAETGLACGVEFFHHVGKEQDLRWFAPDLACDGAIAVSFALAADAGVEPVGNQWCEIAGFAVTENSFCAGTEPDEYTYRGCPAACHCRNAGAASGCMWAR